MAGDLQPRGGRASPARHEGGILRLDRPRLLAGAPARGGPHAARAGRPAPGVARGGRGRRRTCARDDRPRCRVRRQRGGLPRRARRGRLAGRGQPDRPCRSPHRRHAHLERAGRGMARHRRHFRASRSRLPEPRGRRALAGAVLGGPRAGARRPVRRDPGRLPARRAVGAARRHHLLAVGAGPHQGRPRLRSAARDRGPVPGHRPAHRQDPLRLPRGGGDPAGGAASTGPSAAGTRSAACASRPSPPGAGRASWARPGTTSTTSATSATSTSPATRTRSAPSRATAA